MKIDALKMWVSGIAITFIPESRFAWEIPSLPLLFLSFIFFIVLITFFTETVLSKNLRFLFSTLFSRNCKGSVFKLISILALRTSILLTKWALNLLATSSSFSVSLSSGFINFHLLMVGGSLMSLIIFQYSVSDLASSILLPFASMTSSLTSNYRSSWQRYKQQKIIIFLFFFFFHTIFQTIL